jgi:hypothetical protein
MPPGTSAGSLLPAAWRRDVIVAAAVLVGVVLLGAPVGLLWAHVSPHVHTVVTAAGVDITDPEPESFIASDGFFLFLTLGVGLVIGALVAWFDNAPSPVTAIALAAGGCLAAVVAWHVGHRVGLDSFRDFLVHGQLGQHMDAVVRLRAKTAILGWGVGALVSYGAVVAVRPVRPPVYREAYGASVG